MCNTTLAVCRKKNTCQCDCWQTLTSTPLVPSKGMVLSYEYFEICTVKHPHFKVLQTSFCSVCEIHQIDRPPDRMFMFPLSKIGDFLQNLIFRKRLCYYGFITHIVAVFISVQLSYNWPEMFCTTHVQESNRGDQPSNIFASFIRSGGQSRWITATTRRVTRPAHGFGKIVTAHTLSSWW